MYIYVALNIILLVLVKAGEYDTELYETEPCESNACFEDLKGSLGDCTCNVDTIDYFNNVKIHPRIQSLVVKDYFRFYKVNFRKGCPFWVDDSRCAMRYCHIEPCARESIPGFQHPTSYYDFEAPNYRWRENAQTDCTQDEKDLGYLNKTISPKSQGEIERWRVHDEALDNFCESYDYDIDAEYVDLTLNPERFTGYQGPSAHRIWRSIYEENCFRPKQSPYAHFPYVLSSDMSNLCLEKRVFYRAISGLHSSINIHLCAQYLFSDPSSAFTAPEGVWGTNIEEFRRRFDPSLTRGEGPIWLKNLYFLYLLEMRALAKAGPYLEREEYYTGNEEEDIETREAVKDMIKIIYTFPDHFNESTMFNGGIEAAELKVEFREHFWNISRIMDCVGCDKCKLWGKLQIQGLGTALKILFSGKFDYIDPDSGGILTVRHRNQFQLKRMEIVSLFNAFSRLSNSIRQLETFRTMLSKERKSLPAQIFGGPFTTNKKQNKVNNCKSQFLNHN